MTNADDPRELRQKEGTKEQDLEKLAEKARPLLPALFPKGTTFVKVALPGVSILDPEDVAATKDAMDQLTPYQLMALTKRLRVAAKLLRTTQTLSEAVEKSEQEHTRLQELLDQNLAAVYKQMRPIEVQYRTLNQFFENGAAAPGDKLSVEVFNTPPAELFVDASEALATLAREIQETNAEAFNQSKAKSILVIPGHWAENKYLTRLEEVLADNRVVLFTDIFAGTKNIDNFDAAADRLELESYKALRQGSFGRAHMVVCVNELCGRPKYAWEDDHVWLPASSSIAGKVYFIDQAWQGDSVRDGAAGYRNGKVKAATPMVRMKLNKGHVGAFNQKYSVIPLVEERGELYIQGVRTLCTDETMKQYPAVRIHDFIIKTMLDFSRLLLFERFDETSKEKVKAGLRRFFDYLVKQQVIESYANLVVERDGKPGEKGKAKVNVQVKFYDVVEQVRVGADFNEDGSVAK